MDHLIPREQPRLWRVRLVLIRLDITSIAGRHRLAVLANHVMGRLAVHLIGPEQVIRLLNIRDLHLIVYLLSSAVYGIYDRFRWRRLPRLLKAAFHRDRLLLTGQCRALADEPLSSADRFLDVALQLGADVTGTFADDQSKSRLSVDEGWFLQSCLDTALRFFRHEAASMHSDPRFANREARVLG